MFYVLDTNILIGFLSGDKKIAKWIFEHKSDFLIISFITKIEILSLKDLNNDKIYDIEKFLDVFHNVNIDEEIIKLSSALRRNNLLTLGDAVIAATAISRKSVLITNDKNLAKKVKNLIEVASL